MIERGEIAVDLFSGGGGASEGVRRALGRAPGLAVNHDPAAVAMHEANHPATMHLCGDVWDVEPRNASGGRLVGLLWASPACNHFSKAKGGKPRSAKQRALAWVIVRWAREVKPRVICLENVEEFANWGPLDAAGHPVEAKKGWTFRVWLGQLKAAGYHVEWRELRACDYGAPTTRKRLFLIARRDGQPIVWPAATHGPGRAQPYRTAAECIDWSIPCPSIFGRAKPLADSTLRRIARGIRKFVLGTAEPFVIQVSHGGDDRVYSVREPVRTITASSRSPFDLVVPSLVHVSNGERKGQAPRVYDIQKPLGTVVAGGVKQGLVAAFLAKHFGGHESPGQALSLPLGTVTCRDHHALVTASTDGDCRDAVRAFLTKYNGDTPAGPRTGQSLRLQFDTLTATPRFGRATVHGTTYEIRDIGMRLLAPRELFRAQGFADSYVIDPLYRGKPLTKTMQIRMCGNSVPPDVVAAILRANLTEREVVAA